LKKEKEKKPNHKLKQFFFSNGIWPPKIGLFERKKKTIIIWNGFEKIKEA